MFMVGLKRSNYTVISALIFVLLFTSNASAYIGPGVPAGTLGSILAGMMGLGMLLFGSIWYPIRRLIGWFKERSPKERTGGVRSESSPS
jgi:hypothetical protein